MVDSYQCSAADLKESASNPSWELVSFCELVVVGSYFENLKLQKRTFVILIVIPIRLAFTASDHQTLHNSTQ